MIMRNYIDTFSASRNQRGFSLVEVLVALLVIAFGLLGVAGMQALSIGNTSTANLRSIAALQASSMAAAMSSNEGYWQTPQTTTTVTVVGTTITGTGMATSAPSTCVASSSTPTACTALQMAEADLSTWGQTLAAVLPNGTGTINCTLPANQPVFCQIVVTWTEKNYAQNQVSSLTNASFQHDFEMTVQP